MIAYFMCFTIAVGLDFFQIVKEKQGKRMLIVYTIMVVIAFAISLYYFLNTNNKVLVI